MLIGERADPALTSAILSLARGIDGVGGVNGVATTHLAPEQVIAYFSVEFDDDLCTPQIEGAVKALEERIRAAHPQVLAIFVKPQTAHEAATRLAERRAGIPPTSDGNDRPTALSAVNAHRLAVGVQRGDRDQASLPVTGAEPPSARARGHPAGSRQ